MGRIAEMARRHWQEHLPAPWAALPPDRQERLLVELETEAEQQIETLAEGLAQREAPADPATETFADRAGRLRTAQAMAESTVLRELVLVDPVTSRAELERELEPGEPAAPEDATDRELREAMAEFAQARMELEEIVAGRAPLEE